MPTPLLTAVAVAVALAGLVLVGYGGVTFRPVYHVLRNDPVPIRELEGLSGPAEVTGTATVDERADDAGTPDARTVVAPFSGADCLAYRYEVQEYRQAGKTSYWETLAEGGDGVPFLIDDGSDLLPVDPTGADLRLEKHVTKVDAGEEPPEHIAQYIEETDAVDPNDQTVDLRLFEMNVGSPQRFVERRLDVGEDVYVYGTVRRPEEAPAWGSDRVDAVIGAGDGAPFVVSDSSEQATALRLALRPLGSVLAGLLMLLCTAWLALQFL